MNLPTQTSETTSSISPERQAELKTRLLEFTEQELQKMNKTLIPLLELRHDLFGVNGTEYSKNLPIADQLYDHPSNNVDFVAHDMGLRNGNALDYHQTTEKYDKGFSEENANRDFEYRQAILAAAQELGFIARHPGVATDPLDRSIGILDSELEPIQEKVAAIVMDPGAGMTGVKRLRDAARNIESGAINTDRIIVASSTRPISDAEKSRMKPPFVAGDTEFESTKLTVERLFGVEFTDDETEIDMVYGTGLKAKVDKVAVTIGDRIVTIEVIEAPFDPNRTMTDGSKAKRTNTIEAYKSTFPLLEGTTGDVVIESHDTWRHWQDLIARMIFELEEGRNIHTAGPLNADRVYWSEENGEKTVEILSPQDVIDEMIKTYEQLVKLQTSLS